MLQISIAILHLQQTGVIESIWKRTLLEIQSDCSLEQSSVTAAVNLVQMQGLWYVLLSGLAIAILILLFERIFVFVLTRKDHARAIAAEALAQERKASRLGRRASTMLMGFLGGDEAVSNIEEEGKSKGSADEKRTRNKSVANLSDLMEQRKQQEQDNLEIVM